jgi:hypothetical protein
MLIVQTVQFVADGRSMVNTVGGKRFQVRENFSFYVQFLKIISIIDMKVLKYGMLDGCGRAVVRFFSDVKVPPGPELKGKCYYFLAESLSVHYFINCRPPNALC